MESSSINDLREIRQMMEKSSRFISLSGWSGVAAGATALLGAYMAHRHITHYYAVRYGTQWADPALLKRDLLWIAGLVFICAFILSFFFTYVQSRKKGVPIWGTAARKLLWNTLLPMAVGGIFIFRLMQLQMYPPVAASSLLFYGLALINGSRFTVGEIRYLGYGQLLTGIYCLWAPGHGLMAWAFGFGILHIVYGLAMWWKYERNQGEETT